MFRLNTLFDHAIAAGLGTVLLFNFAMLTQQLYAASAPGLA